MTTYRNKHAVTLTPWAAKALADEDYSRILHVARALGIRMELSARTTQGPYEATIWADYSKGRNFRLDSWGPSPIEAATRVLRSFADTSANRLSVPDPELALLIGAEVTHAS